VRRVELLPPPAAFGFDPGKYPDWRRNQDRAILDIANSKKRFVVQNAPVGFGKSLAYAAAHVLTGLRTAILTSTRGLEDQLEGDFAHIGLQDVRGRENYGCMYLDPHVARRISPGMLGGGDGGGERGPYGATGRGQGCHVGPCLHGVPCQFIKTDGIEAPACHYYRAKYEAGRRALVVTNFAYWLHAGQDDKGGIGKFDLLVIDEAHRAQAELGRFLKIEIRRADIELIGGRWPGSGSGAVSEKAVKDAARQWLELTEREIAALREWLLANFNHHRATKLTRLTSLKKTIERIATLPKHWIFEDIGGSAVWEPLWPGDAAEEHLYRGAKKVVFVSGTISRKSIEKLGVKPGEFDFFEYPSDFPKERRPVIRIPTVRLDKSTSVDGLRQSVVRIDQIVGRRPNWKGIIHTVSYERAKFVAETSIHRSIMMTHNSRTTRQVIEEFKAASAPRVLVSPAVTTGYDFPYELCRYQIIMKIPFPDTRSAITKARLKDDPDYRNMVAMETIQQSVGRGMRANDDYQECFVIDDHWVWFLPGAKKYAANWFLEAVRDASTVPGPGL
jgi:ATP-dependent DNA helicase DinG